MLTSIYQEFLTVMLLVNAKQCVNILSTSEVVVSHV